MRGGSYYRESFGVQALPYTNGGKFIHVLPVWIYLVTNEASEIYMFECKQAAEPSILQL